MCRKFLFRTKDGSLSQEAVIFCENLVSLCCQMHFDGYLINIECALSPDEVLILLDWLSMLRTRLKSCICHSLLIWYDAVTIDGTLVWQNALNSKNKPFFDVCDAIFLNYAWTQSAATSSAAAAGCRKCDVFLGVDIFGRGTFGGGKLNSHAASAVAQVRGASFLCAVHLFVLNRFTFDHRIWGVAWLFLHPVGRTNAHLTAWTLKSMIQTPECHSLRLFISYVTV